MRIDSNTSEEIKRVCVEEGFDDVGFCRPEYEREASLFLKWLKMGYHGGMDYMEKSKEVRANPRRRYPWAKSAIIVLKNYRKLIRANEWRISIYALGRDYHRVVKKMLMKVEKRLTERFSCRTKIFVDTSPMMEKPLAKNAGLGWIGKNSCLVTKKGSYFFIGGILTDMELGIKEKIHPSLCGSCRKCIDACPTGAIVAPHVVDARKCISYLTIENKGKIPEELRKQIGNRIFGCDACQEACPWNSRANETKDERLSFPKKIFEKRLLDFARFSVEDFNKFFEGTAIKRCGYEGFIRNVCVALGNKKDLTIQEILSLRRLSRSGSSIVKEHAKWALKNSI